MPTQIDLAGGNAQSLGISVDGRTLAPHLGGAGGHDEAIGEYLAEGAIAPVVMIRRGKFKFIHSPADPDQLFDLERDPAERDNLADSPACAVLVADFRAEVGKRWDFAKLDSQSLAIASAGAELVDAALSKGKIQAWDFQPFRKAIAPIRPQLHGSRRPRGDGSLSRSHGPEIREPLLPRRRGGLP